MYNIDTGMHKNIWLEEIRQDKILANLDRFLAYLDQIEEVNYLTDAHLEYLMVTGQKYIAYKCNKMKNIPLLRLKDVQYIVDQYMQILFEQSVLVLDTDEMA